MPRDYRRYFRLGLGRRDAERELDEEIEAHLAMRTEALERGGETPAHARAEALRRFGDVAEAKRRLRASVRERDVRLTRWARLDGLRRDVRHALRQFRRAPGYASAVVLIFAAGIGLTTAMYAVIDHVLLRALPYGQADRLIGLLSVDSAGNAYPYVSMGNWVDWRAQSRSLAETALHFPRSYTVELGDETVRVRGQAVAGDFFAVVGTPMVLGRTFEPEEVARGEGLAVVSERFWRSRMRATRLMPQRLRVDGREVQITGVLPEGSEYPAGTEVFLGMPWRAQVGVLRNNVSWYAIGRLASGVSAAGARAELSGIAARIRAADPVALYSWGVGVEPLRDRVVGEGTRSLVLLMAGVVLVLLIACANIAGLSVARASTRTQEIAVRMALGASVWRVRVQLLVELLVLAAAGGALGALLANALTRALVRRAAAWIPRAHEVSIDARILGFAFAATVLAGALAALAPVIRSARLSIRARAGAQRGIVAGGRSLPGAVLVTAEVALALMLLTAGGLLWRSFRSVLSQDLGYEANVIAADLALTPAAYRQDRARQLAFWDELLRRTRELRGVTGAGLANAIPTGTAAPTFIEVEGVDVGRAAAGYRITSDDYFDVLRIPLLAGRWFDRRDTEQGPRVVLVNQRFAEAFLAGANPLGQRIRASSSEGFLQGNAPWLTVIGVVGNVRHWSFESEPEPELYVLHRQAPASLAAMTLVVRATAGVAAALGPAVRAEIRALDAGVGADIAVLNDRVRAIVGGRRLTMSVIHVFAAIALALAAIGVYGLISFAVSQRTRELGVRAALGANQSGLLRMILGSALRILLAGAAIGMAGALALSQLMAALLFGIGPVDGVSYGIAALVILSVTLAAAFVPAWRASRLDPLISLRQS